MKIPNKDVIEERVKILLNGNAILLDELRFNFGEITFTIPKGFKTDGTSIPLLNHYSEKYVGAGILHDYLYRRGLLDRRIADAFFRHVLKETNNRFISFILWLGVRIFAGRFYNMHKKSKKNMI